MHYTTSSERLVMVRGEDGDDGENVGDDGEDGGEDNGGDEEDNGDYGKDDGEDVGRMVWMVRMMIKQIWLYRKTTVN